MADRALKKIELNAETARLAWPELERSFARGVVIVIAESHDLVDIATSFALDEAEVVSAGMANGTIRKATDADAVHWAEIDADFWAVVVAPFVLVQVVS